MGCDCEKDKQKSRDQQRQAALVAGSIKTVALPVLKERRTACRECEYAQRSPNPKYAKFGGLTNLSKCTVSNKPLVAILKDPNFECPMKKFGKNE